ncbi:MAG TPA: hypothetical protein VFG94_14300, partial [Acidimicrobiales bacterium]|nr:hypothetical protein [Acidimicrobiales bacterium]
MTTCWDARIRRGAGGALLLLAMGAATPAAGAPAQVPAASIVATPSTVVAGGDVSLSGQCPAGTTNAALQVFFFIGDHGMWLDTTAPALADGTFLTSITVPSDAEAGLWAAAVDCDGLGTDVAETAFEVTGGGEPMVLAPESFPVGGPLHLESSGCVASGVLLDTTTIVVYLDADEGLSLLTIVAVPTNPDGSWSADVALPPEAAGADLFVTVECA